MSCSLHPYSTGGRSLHLDRGAIDRTRVLRQGLHQRFEDGLPEVAMTPAIEAIVDRGIRAVDGRTVHPAAAAAQDMYDATDDASIILPPGPGVDLR
jgi:hypothetical protein